MSNLPFTYDQFLGVFEVYNTAIWPVQLIAYIVGIFIIYLVIKEERRSETFLNGLLGLFWLWTGIVYHIVFFAEINPAAYIFGALFILQGGAFFVAGLTGNKLRYGLAKDIYSVTGVIFILYSIIIYPLLGYSLGHIYPQSPVFGVAPCPTTIFTFGILLQAKAKVPVWLFVIPGLWALIGFSAAFQLGIYEDIGLIVAGILGVGMMVFKNYKSKFKIAYGT